MWRCGTCCIDSVFLPYQRDGAFGGAALSRLCGGGVFHHPSIAVLRAWDAAVGAVPAAAEGVEMCDEKSLAVVNPHLGSGKLVADDEEKVVLLFVGSEGVGNPEMGSVAAYYSAYGVHASSHGARHKHHL